MAKEKSAPAAKKPAGIIVRNILIGLLVVAFVGVGAFGLLSRTRFLMDKLTALEFGGEKISALEYKIYYKTNEMNFISQYGTTLQLYYGVDLSQPLETQPYGDGTWGDYLHSAAQSGIDSPQRGVAADHGPAAGTSSPLYSCSCQPSSATTKGRVASPSTSETTARALDRNASAVPCP